MPFDKEEMQEMPNKQSSEGQDPDTDDEGSTGNHITDGNESEVPDSEDDLGPGAIDIADAVHPSFIEDINSKLQDQGIGVAGDAFNTQIQIIGTT
jgi:hypothetical protein